MSKMQNSQSLPLWQSDHIQWKKTEVSMPKMRLCMERRLMVSTHAEEIENIINALGRGDLTEGKVRGTHLGKILIYLQMKGTEKYQDTLHKLALIMGMNIRYVRENYLRGLELFGVIKTKMVGNELIWKWMGDIELDQCLSNNGYNEQEQTATEYMQEKEKQKKKEKKKK